MKKKSIIIPFLSLILLAGICFIQCAPTPPSRKLVLRYDDPCYDSITSTYSFTVLVDSADGTIFEYSLMDADSVLYHNETGVFTGIEPFNEGYDLMVKAVWQDTTIVHPSVRVWFPIFVPSVNPMTKEELTQLINAEDMSLQLNDNPHIAQGIEVVVTDAKLEASSLFEVIEYIHHNQWSMVEVTAIHYNEQQRIDKITLKPKKEILPEPPVESDDDIDFSIL